MSSDLTLMKKKDQYPAIDSDHRSLILKYDAYYPLTLISLKWRMLGYFFLSDYSTMTMGKHSNF